jgi:hypothetical protein
MATEQTEYPQYMSPTAPGWVAYYERARKTRHGQTDRFHADAKRRRLHANAVAIASTAVLVALVAIFAALLN